MEKELNPSMNQAVPPMGDAADGIQFEAKLYRTLRAIDAALIPEYMESFGLEGDQVEIGNKFKACADKMTEAEFVTAMQGGKLSVAALSPTEIEVLYRGTQEYLKNPGKNTAEC